MSQDYIFRYRLDLESLRNPVYHHPPTELVRRLLEALLGIIIPLKAGSEMCVDEFRWIGDKGKVQRIFPETSSTSLPDSALPFQSEALSMTKEQQNSLPNGKQSEAKAKPPLYQNPRNAALYEPRIELIKNLLESILSLGELERDGQVAKVDGFRLKNLHDWLVPGSGDPSEIFDYTASHCSCDCVFCCNKGNPPTLATADNLKRSTEEEFEEIKTRIKYFSPQAKSTLFSSLGTVYEVTIHPHFLEILHLLREKSSKPFRITTNGRDLTPETIAELAKLKPVYLYLSLNSSSPARRRKLMADTKPEIAIGALPLLRQQNLPYTTVIVPWPAETINEMLADLSSTIGYAAENETHLIQVNLPGYSKYFSPNNVFNLDQVWQAIVSQVRELRGKYGCPIVVMPTLYEENIYQSRKNLPQIIGLVKNSPAYLGGLERGDIILGINGLSIRNRPQACDLLLVLQRSEAKEATLKVQRGSQTLEVNLDLSGYSYPYSKEMDAHLGIIFMGTGLRMSYIERLKEIVQARGAKRVLFLSSALVEPTFEQCLRESHLFGNNQVNIDVKIPQNCFFGGNIFMGDLLVVQDFIDCIKEYIIEEGSKPDLVVIPSSPFNLGGWGRDLRGRVYLDIERETGVPVEILSCATIYD